VAHVHQLARLGIGLEADVGVLVLQVEQASHCMGRTGELGMFCSVFDLLAAQPQLTVVFESCEELRSGSCGH